MIRFSAIFPLPFHRGYSRRKTRFVKYAQYTGAKCVEAARERENGEVRLAFIDMNEAILLVVRNTFDEQLNLKVHEIYQEGFSTKGENRGLGLANLRQMKNSLTNVNLNTKINAPYFVQEIEFQKG